MTGTRRGSSLARRTASASLTAVDGNDVHVAGSIRREWLARCAQRRLDLLAGDGRRSGVRRSRGRRGPPSRRALRRGRARPRRSRSRRSRLVGASLELSSRSATARSRSSRVLRGRSRTASAPGRAQARPRARTARPTATMIGQPATDAFCTSSNESRPLTQRTRSASGSKPSRNAQPTTLSSALCRPTSSRTQTKLALGREETRGVEPAGRGERALGLSQPLGKRRHETFGDLQLALHPRSVDTNRLDRPLPADAARGRRVEVPPQALRVEPGRLDVDRVGGEVVRNARGERRQPLREAEAERELLVVPRCPHRDRDRLTADPDLERLLDREDLLPFVAARQTNRLNDARRVGRRRWIACHAASVLLAFVASTGPAGRQSEENGSACLSLHLAFSSPPRAATCSAPCPPPTSPLASRAVATSTCARAGVGTRAA